MIFEVAPSRIEDLDSAQFVNLLRRLLHAEAQKTGISLRGVSVPLQITVPDGGEDARISWDGGRSQTDYLPSRFTIFQSKATDPKPAGWKKEVWSESSKKTGVVRKLNDAVTTAIAQQGSYVGFTSIALGGIKTDRRIEGIREGIREAGGKPEELAAIDIYDANKIAQWVSKHPAVAVWLNEIKSGLALRGFQTIEGWGKKAEITSIERIEDNAARYGLGAKNLVAQHERKDPEKHTLTFQQAKERISDFLADPQKCVRLLGPSGIGKTRFAYEVFQDKSTVSKISASTTAIFCDHRDFGPSINQIVSSLAESGNPTLLIVDECPREAAIRLYELATAISSGLRIITIGIDDRPIEAEWCLNISVSPADDALIGGIVKQRIPQADDTEVSFIRNLCGGYPRIAVLATNNYVGSGSILQSVEDVVDRILSGCNITENDQVRALECLALFERLGADGELGDQIDFVAENLARQTGDEMYEHLAQASEHHVVDRRGRYYIAQPLPIAVFLGARRLNFLRTTTILKFIDSASPSIVLSFLTQWRHFDVSRTAVAVAEKLLATDGKFGSLEVLNTEFGSKCIDALVHVSPDAAADAIDRIFGALSVDELTEIKDGRRYLVWALQKLVFRNQSFGIAARLLMRLAAAENEDWGNNATGQFKQVFQLNLSGTEAAPSDRFSILDEGLSSGDDRLVSVCVDALEVTVWRSHFSRSGGSEQIGSQPPLKDWRPKIWGEVFDFHRNGLQRLDQIRGQQGTLSERCEQIIATHIRGLLCENLFEDLRSVITKIVAEKGIWLEAIKSVGDWLYFDRKDSPEEFSKKVRTLYDDLMPTDPIQKALLYTKFWSANIRNPDWNYDREDSSTRDFEYSTRKAREIAAEIAVENELVNRTLQTMAAEELHNAFPFAHELALRVRAPVEMFKSTIGVLETSTGGKGIQFLRGMLRGIDERNEQAAKQCIEIARDSDALKDQMVNIYTAVQISVERLQEITESLRTGMLSAADCAFLSYGRGLDDLPAKDILPLIDELTSNHAAEGIWTALEIISMYQHGRTELDRDIAARIMKQITSPELLGEVRRATRDGYLFEQLTLLIQKHFGIDDQFAAALSGQIIRLCQVDQTEVFFALDAPARKLIRLLVQERPKQLWETFSRFFETATALEAHWLEDLIGPGKHGFDGEGHNREGTLYGIPDQECFDWARADPGTRSPFLCKFYPVLEKMEGGEYVWHPSLEKLVHEFGDVKEFRDALSRRFHPSSWSGSLVPYLEVYLEPLEKWFSHVNPGVALWSRDIYGSLEKWISAEQKREDEDPFG